NDATGKPIRTWTSRLYNYRTAYDEVRRPIASFVKGGDPADADSEQFRAEIQLERIVYGDSDATSLSPDDRRKANLRGRTYRHFDGAGVETSEQFDFKGNLVRHVRQFTVDCKKMPNWAAAPALEAETVAAETTFDALNRPLTLTSHD